MSCKVRVRRGILVYRLFWSGYESQEGTRLRDTPKNREKLESKARVMSDQIKDRTFDYLHWFPDGNKASLFRDAPPAPAVARRTIADWAESVWLPRKVPPLVRTSPAETYRKHLRNHLLPRFGGLHFADVTVGALADFRVHLVAAGDSGKGSRRRRRATSSTARSARSTATPARKGS